MHSEISGLPQAFAVLNSGYFHCVALSAIFVVIDLSQERISLKSFIHNLHFYLLFLLQAIASSVAFFVLHAYPPVKDWPNILLAIFAVFGSSLILQNQLVKIAGKPIVDLSELQRAIRQQALAQAAKEMARLEKGQKLRITDDLACSFKGRDEELEDIFIRVMLFGRVDENEIKLELHRIRNRCELLGLASEYELARIIVQTDIEYAIRVLRHSLSTVLALTLFSMLSDNSLGDTSAIRLVEASS